MLLLYSAAGHFLLLRRPMTLARGEIGIYHLDLTVPSDLPRTSSNTRGGMRIPCSGDLVGNMAFEFPRNPAVKVIQ